MPYIAQDKRTYLDPGIEEVLKNMPSHPGEMNYIITKLMMKYVEWRGNDYQAYNSAIGVLECCKLEFYREFVAEYEEICKAKNGGLL